MSSNATSGAGFGQFVPGFEFLQSLVNPPPAASSGLGGMPSNLANWVAPTLNVEDLEKRIEELKAVHFWLDQNSKALSATIQAMEVQKMTLATLRDLNVSFGDVAKAGEAARNAAAETMSKGFAGFQMPSVAEPEPEPAPAQEAEPAAPKRKAPKAAQATQAKADQIDPMQWWGALQQQFQNIAVNTLQDLAKQQPPAGGEKAGPAKGRANAAPAKKKASPGKKKAATKTRPR